MRIDGLSASSARSRRTEGRLWMIASMMSSPSKLSFMFDPFERTARNYSTNPRDRRLNILYRPSRANCAVGANGVRNSRQSATESAECATRRALITRTLLQEIQTMSNRQLLTPQNSAVIFIDHQPQMAFGVTSIDRQWGRPLRSLPTCRSHRC